jgi:hypothetical protein
MSELDGHMTFNGVTVASYVSGQDLESSTPFKKPAVSSSTGFICIRFASQRIDIAIVTRLLRSFVISQPLLVVVQVTVTFYSSAETSYKQTIQIAEKKGGVPAPQPTVAPTRKSPMTTSIQGAATPTELLL